MEGLLASTLRPFARNQNDGLVVQLKAVDKVLNLLGGPTGQKRRRRTSALPPGRSENDYESWDTYWVPMLRGFGCAAALDVLTENLRQPVTVEIDSDDPHDAPAPGGHGGHSSELALAEVLERNHDLEVKIQDLEAENTSLKRKNRTLRLAVRGAH